MKTCAISLFILLCFYQPVSSKIINGFLHEKVKLERELKDLLKVANSGPEKNELRRYKRKVKLLGKKYVLISQKFEETNQLLSEFYKIDPNLYDQVSNVTDADGTINHVYVRLVDSHDQEIQYLSKSYFRAFGYTSVGQWEKNENACKSAFGAYTISILIQKGCDVNIALAHEFAHVLYIVPNLQDYIDFYMNNCSQIINKHSKGHSPYDPGLILIGEIEESFKMNYRKYVSESTSESQEDLLLLKTNLILQNDTRFLIQ